ncbi:DNA 5' exonuclease [Schizosaccharomyces pombe]|uniref:DNA cross-link repair protein pso2/snm1 n=1 Tax=Schizosaccharomyces pombe (strain 972 / ATCC 24843) TaxID=284812 RepID=PSO2_SCHPO|nr:putative DNA 5' exonuclease [Schizosaccharomyces pombe]Q10264.3 RecName: Full=DNA cross-link repair protein pso2/snm1 [Schizosaccharomyces pombe 972h-]CAA93588.2 DNA 5' exonuclease (predicted) [Schizosaccharomyces pombe]|eukprot:NP_593231.2 putative DNA 5' exonuclease [Schizosaccharomyces pombe]
MSKRKSSSILDFFKKSNNGKNMWGNEAVSVEKTDSTTKPSTVKNAISSSQIKNEKFSQEVLLQFNDPSFTSEVGESPQWQSFGDANILEPLKNELVKNEESTMSELLLCPICGITLESLTVDANIHVNDCLDGRTTEAVSKKLKKDSVVKADPSNSSTFPISDSCKQALLPLPGKQINVRSVVPFYKLMPYNIPFAVDAFAYGAIDGVEAYFLSHFHSDHYGGLTPKWKHGPIYCSEVTGNLLINVMHVDEQYVKRLKLNQPYNIMGITVYVLDANHCPGSAMFVFETLQSNQTRRVLHCGDFRASKDHVMHPVLREKTIHKVYLDTTYLNPKYTFPPQADVVQACADKAISIKKSTDSRLLVVVSTYSIGKEKVAVAIAKSLSSRIYVVPRKMHIIKQLENQDLIDLLTDDPTQASVHMVTMMGIHPNSLLDYLEQYNSSFDKIIGYKVTGWTFQPLENRAQLSSSLDSIISRPPKFVEYDLRAIRGSTDKVAAFVAPYSEHSSFYDLTMFCLSMNIGHIIPTVNVGSQRSREKMNVWLDRWAWRRKKQGLLSLENVDW